MTVIWAVLVAAEIGLAVSSAWNLLILAFIVPAIAFSLFVFPKRLRARIALLSEEPQEPVLRTQ